MPDFTRAVGDGTNSHESVADSVIKRHQEAKDPASDPENVLRTRMALDPERERLIRQHEAVQASPEYRHEVELLASVNLDFLFGLRISWYMASQVPGVVDDSFFLRNADEFLESAASVCSLVRQGVRNPSRRELRFTLEFAVKALFVDQSMPGASFKDKLTFFERRVSPSGIQEAKALKLAMYESTYADQVRRAIETTWGLAGRYVHPSVHQIRERVEEAERGVFVGFETPVELNQVTKLMFECYALVLALGFHVIGPALAGDVFEHVLRERAKWVYHSSSHIANIDAHFDYKAERQPSLDAIRADRVKRLGSCPWPQGEETYRRD